MSNYTKRIGPICPIRRSREVWIELSGRTVARAEIAAEINPHDVLDHLILGADRAQAHQDALDREDDSITAARSLGGGANG